MYYKVKVNYPCIQNDQGKIVSKNEVYLTDAVSFADSEFKASEKANEINSNYEVKAISRYEIDNIHLDPENTQNVFFEVKFQTLTVDESTGKEKKNTFKIVIICDDKHRCDKLADEFIKPFIIPVKILHVKETEIVEVI
jgi:hypothetical protein